MKRLLIALGVVAGLIAAAAGAVYFFFDPNQLRPRLEAELTRVLNREVKVGDIRLALLEGSVQASDLSIADDPAYSKEMFLKARLLKAGVELKPLLFDRKVNVTGIVLEQPEVVLIQAPGGEWNFSSLGGPSKPAAETGETRQKVDLLVRSILITGGRVTVAVEGTRRVFEKLNLTVREFSPSSAIPFTLDTESGTMKIKLDGRVGPLAESDKSLTPVQAKVNVTGLDLASSGFFSKAAGIGGVVALDGTLETSGRAVDTQGTVQAERLKLSRFGSPAKRPVRFDFTIHHNTATKAGTLSKGDVFIGKAATLTGSYSAKGATPSVNMKLTGDRMAIAELEEMLPPLNVELPQGSRLEGGVVATRLAIEGPVDRLAVEGPIAIHQTRLVGFDLGSRIKTIAKFAGIKVGPDTDIATLSAHVRRNAEGTEIHELQFSAPEIGDLTGSGTVSQKNELDFTMNVMLHTSGTLMTALGQKDGMSAKFYIRGTATAPSFVPDVKSLAAQTAKTVLQEQRVKTVLDKTLNQSDVGKAARGLLDGLLGGKKN